MRTTLFGEPIVESVDDDMGLIESLQEAGTDIHAIIYKEDDSDKGDKFYFEVRGNEDGEVIVASDPIFNTFDMARAYLGGWVSNIQRG